MNSQTNRSHGAPSKHIMVRLADEGVPVAAISRVLKHPFSIVSSVLREAVASGDIVAMPRPDWPPNVCRDEREPDRPPRQVLSDTIVDDIVMTFGATPHEARILAVILKSDVARRPSLHAALYERDGEGGADPKIVDVFICKLRKKLARFDIRIETLWGRGYFLNRDNRQRLLDKIKERRS